MFEITIPKLGMELGAVTLVEWKAREGDWVERGTVVLVIETQKVRWDIEANESGFLHVIVGDGNKAEIGAVVGLLAATREEFESTQRDLQREQPTAVTDLSEPSAREDREIEEEKAFPPRDKGRSRILVSPIARKMAEEHMIDLKTMVGSGPGGRIVREDVEKQINSRKETKKVPVCQDKKLKSVIPLKGMREVIAEHMQRSLAISAQVTLFGEVDMFEIVKSRDLLVGRAKTSQRITYTDILVFVVAKALRDHPIINSSLVGNEINIWEDINIGVAVALEEGIIVPVVKNADEKSLSEISQTLRLLIEKAKGRQLVPEEVTGGTFTITNLGALGGGWRFETAIINQPESAILGIGGITDRVVVRDSQMLIRPVMTYSLTYDHRVVDGAVAAKFVTTVTRLLETPSLPLV